MIGFSQRRPAQARLALEGTQGGVASATPPDQEYGKPCLKLARLRFASFDRSGPVYGVGDRGRLGAHGRLKGGLNRSVPRGEEKRERQGSQSAHENLHDDRSLPVAGGVRGAITVDRGQGALQRWPFPPCGPPDNQASPASTGLARLDKHWQLPSVHFVIALTIPGIHGVGVVSIGTCGLPVTGRGGARRTPRTALRARQGVRPSTPCSWRCGPWTAPLPASRTQDPRHRLA